MLSVKEPFISSTLVRGDLDGGSSNNLLSTASDSDSSDSWDLLKKENDFLKKELVKLKRLNCFQHSSIEQEEEFITNKLLKHICSLKQGINTNENSLIESFHDRFNSLSLKEKSSSLSSSSFNDLDHEEASLRLQDSIDNCLMPNKSRSLSQSRSGFFKSSPSSNTSSQCTYHNSNINGNNNNFIYDEPVRRKSFSMFKPSNHRRRVSTSFESPLYSLNDPSLSSSTNTTTTSSGGSSTTFTNNLNSSDELKTVEGLRFVLNSSQCKPNLTEKSIKTRYQELEAEYKRLMKENLLLRHKVQRGHEEVDHLNQEKEALIREVECTSERWFNSTCSLITSSSPQSPALSRVLRSRSQSLSRSSDMTPLFSSPRMSRSISLQEHRPRSVSCSSHSPKDSFLRTSTLTSPSSSSQLNEE